MKKTNFILKTFIILLFSSISVFSASFNKKKRIIGHEINLRNLEDSKLYPVINIIFIVCSTSNGVTILIELFAFCYDRCKCDCENELPNRCTFIYFYLNGFIIVFIVFIIFRFINEGPNKSAALYFIFTFLAILAIFSIIYHIKYCRNRAQYCNEICTKKHLAKLASYPYKEYSSCFCYDISDFSCRDCSCNNSEISCCNIIISFICIILNSICMLIYIIGTVFYFYLSLLIYMFLMLFTKLFTCNFSCDGNSDNNSGCCSCCSACCSCCSCCSCCCECCHCCKCCSKENKQDIPSDNKTDVCVTTLRAEAYFYESYEVNESVENKNNNENNDEIEEENVYENNNDNDIVISTNILLIANNTK